jgi:hypothetical protein
MKIATTPLKHSIATILLGALAAALVGSPLPADAAPKQVPDVPLTARGEELQSKYAQMLEALKAEVLKALPAVDPARKATFLDARSRFSGLSAPREDAGADETKKYEEALARAEADAHSAAGVLLTDLEGLLADDKLDGLLAKVAVLSHATPRGLAEFAQQGAGEEKLVDQLLADEALMKEILEAGGANGGEYGEAMQVYDAILKASERARERGSIFQRLALGTAIHMPWLHGKPEAGIHGIVHPDCEGIEQVARYLHYEKAYLDGELDPAFKDMNTWECRFITNSEYSNEDLTWTRRMMRVYRPDHITTDDYKWRYVRLIKSDVPYCSTTHDPSLGTRPQMEVALGGICGRRAFLGRLTTRAFGIPTRRSTQTAHAALNHWTPDGWVICLGAWWSVAYCGPQGGLDFLLDSQAREFPEEYRKVLRAQWIGDALGEEDVSIQHGQYGKGGGFWDSMAFIGKQIIVKKAEVKALELAGGMKLGESDELLGDEAGVAVEVPEEERQIAVGGDGVITIPGVACYSPRAGTDRIVFMKSWDTGWQLHYSRLGSQPELVKYRLELPAAGEYELSAQVATVSAKQEMLVRINHNEPAPFGLPYTKGTWQATEPMKVSLEEGRNTISVTARAPNRGVSIKQFQLKPVK